MNHKTKSSNSTALKLPELLNKASTVNSKTKVKTNELLQKAYGLPIGSHSQKRFQNISPAVHELQEKSSYTSGKYKFRGSKNIATQSIRESYEINYIEKLFSSWIDYQNSLAAYSTKANMLLREFANRVEDLIILKNLNISSVCKVEHIFLSFEDTRNSLNDIDLLFYENVSYQSLSFIQDKFKDIWNLDDLCERISRAVDVGSHCCQVNLSFTDNFSRKYIFQPRCKYLGIAFREVSLILNCFRINVCLKLEDSISHQSLVVSDDSGTLLKPDQEKEFFKFHIPAIFISSPDIIGNYSKNVSAISIRILNGYTVKGIDFSQIEVSDRMSTAIHEGLLRNTFGFRKRILISTCFLTSDVLSTSTVSAREAHFNQTSINSSCVWHSSFNVQENLTRMRDFEEFYRFSLFSSIPKFPEPLVFRITLKSLEFHELISLTLSKFEEQYQQFQELKSMLLHQEILKSKIAVTEHSYLNKREKDKAAMLDRTQQTLEKKIRKTTQSERAWRMRYAFSTVVSVQGHWEKRVDDRSGMIFYHFIKDGEISTEPFRIMRKTGLNNIDENEQYSKTCQIEIPYSWKDEISFTGHHNSDNEERPQTAIELQNQKPDFEYPLDTWFPSRNNAQIRAQSSPEFSNTVQPLIDDSSLKIFTEKLLIDDSLAKVVARRFGIPESQIQPVEINNDSSDMKLAEFETDSDNSVDFDANELGYEVGNYEEIEINIDSNNNNVKPSFRPSKELKLLPISKGQEYSYSFEAFNEYSLTKEFISNLSDTKVKGPDIFFNGSSLNSPVFLSPVSPVDGCIYHPEAFSFEVESIFVSDIKQEVLRSLSVLDLNLKREQQIAKGKSTKELLYFGQPKDMTSADEYQLNQYISGNGTSDVYDVMTGNNKSDLIKVGLYAAKNSDIGQMENVLEQGLSVDEVDENGNSFLILAAQQGSKSMSKFLLRRGADVNFQNHLGNSALHFCFAHSYDKLGQYLIKKGADDTLLNIDGLTCYEGLNKSMLEL